MDNKTVLVTGATGFIGRYFCQSAKARGLHVIALTRNEEKARDRLPGIQAVEDLQYLSKTKKIHYVINLAGEALVGERWNIPRKQQFLDSRIGVTDKLFEFFKGVDEPPDVLISGSAVGYYGPHYDKVLDEAAKPHESFSHQLCMAWEHCAARFTQLGTRVCYLRTGIVLGPDDGALGRMLTPFKLGFGGRLGNGKQWMSWIHLDDEVALIFHCLKRSDITGSINGSSPNPVTNMKFSQTLGKVLSRPVLFPMAPAVARLLFGEMADELLLTGQRVYPRKALESGFKFSYPELQQALEQILK
ncbi:MAG: TIGR01777 family protein [Porticoccaceae bacterium]|nr:MAG: TIGR01777 family protein [Porticoccaceae bacterium]